MRTNSAANAARARRLAMEALKAKGEMPDYSVGKRTASRPVPRDAAPALPAPVDEPVRRFPLSVAATGRSAYPDSALDGVREAFARCVEQAANECDVDAFEVATRDPVLKGAVAQAMVAHHMVSGGTSVAALVDVSGWCRDRVERQLDAVFNQSGWTSAFGVVEVSSFANERVHAIWRLAARIAGVELQRVVSADADGFAAVAQGVAAYECRREFGLSLARQAEVFKLDLEVLTRRVSDVDEECPQYASFLKRLRDGAEIDGPSSRLIEVQKVVCDEFEISASVLLSSRQSDHLCLARYAFAHLAQKLTTKTNKQFGSFVGVADPTTIRRRARCAAEFMSNDQQFADRVRRCEAVLKGEMPQ